jgi:cytochrome c peroxidase
MMTEVKKMNSKTHIVLLIGSFLSSPMALALSQFSALPKVAPSPLENQMTRAKVELGKQLFFDPRLSATGNVSCNSCHNLMAGGDDNLSTSIGVKGQTGKRSAPTVWNSGFLSALFWDGRAASLEDQAKGPMTNAIEMGMSSHDLVVSRLKSIPGYIKNFETVFGKKGLTIDNVARAIASFERTLVTVDSPFDRFIKGDKTSLSEPAKNGFKLVQEIGCTSCHQGINFAGPSLPSGQGFYQKFPTFPDGNYEKKYKLEDDLGRYEVTKSDSDKHMWRVPTWRNVALTAPYFHNGSVATLEEAVQVMAKVQLKKELSNDNVREIVAFLESLTGRFPKIDMPRLPETAGRSAIVQ